MAARVQGNVALAFPVQAVSFDPSAFDEAIHSQGVKLTHWRGQRCPVGMTDKYDHRRPHDDHSGCSNGFIYTKAGTVTALFTGNSYEERQQDVGLLDGSTVQVTTPRFYDEGPEVRITVFDRLYLKEEGITVEHWELVEAHVTGRDKLKFPVVKVVDVIDANNRRYDPGDYTVENGQLVWTNGGGPGFNAQLNKGVIYSVRYEYVPYFYIQRIAHQVRVAQVETQLERVVMRMPQSMTISREYVFEKSDNDDQAELDSSDVQNALRQVKGPREGQYGPR